MTAMTSSAASETLSARKRTEPPARRSTSTPPPSGMWTSSRTTSGSRRPIASTASSTVAASPTSSTRPSSSARTPARKSWWSSTTSTRVNAAPSARPRCPRPAPNAPRRARRGAPSARRSTRARRAGPPAPPAVARHPPDDRLAHAAPVPRHVRGHEARAAVAHVDLQLVVEHLGEDVDRRARAELRRVDHRLARRGDQGERGLVELGVADDDHLHRHAVVALDLVGRALQRGRQMRRLGPRPPREPPAQLALLAARERRDRARIVGALLHERQR